MRALVAMTLVAIGVVVAPAHAASQSVAVDEFSYRADRVRIEPGETVTWTNRGEVLHTVTSRRGVPQGFNSGEFDSGQTFTRAFTKPGTYGYVCTLHPGLMDGVVQVGPDRVKPVVSGLAARAGKSVSVRYRVSERARVTVKLTRGGRTVRSVRTRKAVDGFERQALKRPAAGRYSVVVAARDLEGNRSKTVRKTLVVR